MMPLSSAKTYGAGSECIVCYANIANVAVLPCRHFLCNTCVANPGLGLTSAAILNDTAHCPNCRGIVQGFQKLDSDTLRSLQAEENRTAIPSSSSSSSTPKPTAPGFSSVPTTSIPAQQNHRNNSSSGEGVATLSELLLLETIMRHHSVSNSATRPRVQTTNNTSAVQVPSTGPASTSSINNNIITSFPASSPGTIFAANGHLIKITAVQKVGGRHEGKFSVKIRGPNVARLGLKVEKTLYSPADMNSAKFLAAQFVGCSMSDLVVQP